MRAPRLRDILWSMKPPGLAAFMLAAMAFGFTGTLANAQSDDLLTAAGRGDLPAVNALLKAGADVNDAKYTGSGSTTALMEAASNGHLEVVQALLAAKADANATQGRSSTDGHTALTLATMNGHLNVLQALLAAKADVNAGSRPALYVAATIGNREMAKVLLAAKPDLDRQDPWLGATALMQTLAPWGSGFAPPNQLQPSDSRWDIARLLVEAGANVNVMTRAGVTALMFAAQENSPRGLEMVQALLAAHADVNGGCVCRTTALLPIGSARHSGAVGYTALGLAASRGSVEVVQALLDANTQRAANAFVVVDAKQLGGNTPLMLASARGRSDIVRLLLAAKADVSAANDEGKTALMLALGNDHPEVAELITSAISAW